MKNNNKKFTGLIAPGGSLAGLFAFVGASCCVLPFILINLGVSSALVAHLNFFALAKIWFLGSAIVLILAGFYLAYRGKNRPPLRTWVFLIIASLLVLSALVLPLFEGDLLRWLKQK